MSQSASPRIQDWRFLMVLFSASSFLELTASGHMLAFSPLFLKNELGVPSEDVARWAGILVSTALGIAVPLSPFWGVLAERYSRKAVILRTEILAGVAYLLMATSANEWQFLAARVVMGFTYGDIAVVMATQSMATPRRQLGTALGVVQMAGTLATSVGPLLGSFIINGFGLRAMFAFDAALSFSAATLIGFMFREPDLHDRSTPVGEKLKLVVNEVVTIPPVRWNFLCWFLLYAGFAAFDPFLPVLIDRLSGPFDSATLIGSLLAVYGLLAAVGTPVAGRLTNRVGTAPLFLLAAPMLALIAAGVATASSLPVLALLVILKAVPQAGTNVVLYTHLAVHVPARYRSAVMSLLPLPRNTAWFLAPALAAAASGFGLSAVFWLAAALFVGTTAVAVLMVRASPAEEGDPRTMSDLTRRPPPGGTSSCPRGG